MLHGSAPRGLGFLNRLRHDRKGGVAIMFMFMVVGLFGFVALAIDTSMWYSTKRRLQTAADAAARAGAYELLRVTVKNEDVVNAATADAAKYGFTSAAGANVQVVPSKDDGTVETTITMPATLNFARLFTSAPPTVRASAMAAAPQSPPPCLTLLEPMATPALSLGGGTKVSSPSCRLQVNSTGNNAIKMNSPSTIDAAQICVGGTNNATGTTVPIEKCTPLQDPLAFWQPPQYGACTQILPILIANQTRTISNTSGTEVFCNVTVTINASNVTFAPGIYVLKDTNLVISNNSTVTGDGVGFLLVGTSKITIDKGTVSLSAPKTGQMAGMIVAQVRDATVGVLHKFDGADVRYEGAFYLPTQDVEYAGQTKSTNVPPFTTFIVRRLTLSGQANLTLNNNYAASDVPVVGKIGSGVMLTK